MTNLEKKLLALLKEEVKPIQGVMEFIPVALASAKACQAVSGKPTRIHLTLDPGLFKGGSACLFPGTNEVGFAFPAVIGALSGDPELGLEIFNDIDEKAIINAKNWIKKFTVTTKLTEEWSNLYVELAIETVEGNARVIIEGSLTNIVLIEADGKQLYRKKKKPRGEKEKGEQLPIANLSFSDFLRFTNDVPFEDIQFMVDAVRVNEDLAQEGLTGLYGMAVGYNMLESLGRESKLEAAARAQIQVAAACDARMDGAAKPAMGIAGSGSHGITAILPVASFAEEFEADEERLARAVTLSCLVALYVKAYTMRHSALCGCAVASSIGAAAGIVHLLNGSDRQIGFAIKNVAADVTGMICHGGNIGCALKTSTGAASAVRGARLALRNVVFPSYAGVINEGIENTIKNLGKISNPGMAETDKVIVDIMCRS